MTVLLTTSSPIYCLKIPNTSFLFNMQTIELYCPTSANLHVIPFTNTDSVAKNIILLHYQLTADNFIVITQLDGQLLYTLNPSKTTSLFWGLQCRTQYITRAASHDLHNDPSTPFVSKGYIPQVYFDCISMKQPDILIIEDHHSINLLCGYTMRENLSVWH